MQDAQFTPSMDAMPEFRVGSVLSKTFSQFGKNFPKLLLLSAIFLAPYFLLTLFVFGTLTPDTTDPSILGPLLLISLSVILFQALLTAAVTHLTIQKLRGLTAPLGQVIGRAFRVVGPVVLVSIVVALLTSLGLILLVVPGLIVATMVYVAVPAVVAEKAGVGEALSRSRALTKGERWKVFAVLLVILVIYYAVSAGSALLIGLVPIAGIALYIFAQLLGYAFLAVSPAVTYFELRQANEGVDIDEIAKVFD